MHVANALKAWQTNARDALSWAHPSWLASLLSLDETNALTLSDAVTSTHRETCSLAFVQSANLPMPSLDEPLFDALPIDIGLRMLRLRALRFRRGEIRRIVDKRTRMNVLQWSGVATLEHITREAGAPAPAPAPAPDIARLSLPSITMLDADALALEGHALIARDTSPSSCAMLRLALPRTSSKHVSWIESVPRGLDSNGTQALVKEHLPEWSWLFG